MSPFSPLISPAAGARSPWRWLWRFAAAILGLSGLSAAGGYLLLRASLPQTTGTLTLRGLEAAVRVVRDAHGVPTIQAQNARDLAVALGFVHAQDRLFQMDLQRRLGAGRLSEIIGPATLGSDRTMRTLGLYRHAAAGVGFASPAFREVLEGYAAGVNAFLGSGAALPIEFTALGYRPDDWRPADSLVIGKLLSLQLTGNYGAELLRARFAAILTPDDMSTLYPDYPEDAPVTLGRLAALTRDLPLDRMMADTPFGVAPHRASNNWVVDGAHSVTGKPLLANDPHLDYAAPLVWYLARLEEPGSDVVGATVAGAPVVILGHNARIAWGYTTTNADAEDLFVEAPDPKDPGRYLTPDGSAPFDTRAETIVVKGAAPASLTVRSTRHGPVISDVLGTPGGPALALEASFLVDDDRSVEAQWRVGLAGDWPGWRAALRLFTAPPQNMVYADRDGHIGFTVPGRIPIRKAGDGRAPVAGADGAHDWVGFVPFEDLPQAFDPPAGHLASANNRIVPDTYPYLITRDWDLPFRIERIEAGLAETPRQSLASSTALQGDIVSLAAAALLPAMLGAAPWSEGARAAIRRLEGWDRRMAADRPEPLIFAAWVAALNRHLFASKLGALYGRYWTASPLVTQGALRQAARWCGEDGCGPVLAASLDEALADLEKRYGPDPAAWSWGAAHRTAFDHPVFSHIPLARDAFDRHRPADGANDTVNAGGFRGVDAETPFADLHGPGFRAVYDLADLESSTFGMAMGQSAHPLSPHYDDLLKPWSNLSAFRLPKNPQGETLTLLP